MESGRRRRFLAPAFFLRAGAEATFSCPLFYGVQPVLQNGGLNFFTPPVQPGFRGSQAERVFACNYNQQMPVLMKIITGEWNFPLGYERRLCLHGRDALFSGVMWNSSLPEYIDE